MDVMNVKCPDCGANMEYDPNSNLMYCAYCGQFHQVGGIGKTNEKEEETKKDWHMDAPVKYDVSSEKSDNNEETVEEEYKSVDSYEANYIEVNVFHCSSCGAEMMTNDVEVTQRCAYCGQAGIIFDRVSKEQKPDKIIPFRFDKETAIDMVKHRFKSAKYLPDEVERITVDSVYGIYMPYWIYDSHMAMGIKLTRNGNNGNYTTKDSEIKDKLIALDASKRLNNDISLLLNPFPVEEAVDFDPSYLSGFWADKFDVPFEARKDDARRVFADELEEEILSRHLDPEVKVMEETYGNIYRKTGVIQVERYGEKYTLKGIYYAFMPIYFITFRISDRLVNILVNGTTGRIIGSVPADPRKVKKDQTVKMIIWGAIMGVVGAMFFRYMPTFWCVLIVLILGVSMFSAGRRAKEKYERIQREANSEAMFSLVRRHD